jgi:hypothetical protein
MNNRIKELFEQALNEFKEEHKYATIVIPNPLKEKFAELIIRECVNICNNIYFDNYPDAEDFERSEEGDAIKKHFGVEE